MSDPKSSSGSGGGQAPDEKKPDEKQPKGGLPASPIKARGRGRGQQREAKGTEGSEKAQSSSSATQSSRKTPSDTDVAASSGEDSDVRSRSGSGGTGSPGEKAVNGAAQRLKVGGAVKTTKKKKLPEYRIDQDTPRGKGVARVGTELSVIANHYPVRMLHEGGVQTTYQYSVRIFKVLKRDSDKPGYQTGPKENQLGGREERPSPVNARFIFWEAVKAARQQWGINPYDLLYDSQKILFSQTRLPHGEQHYFCFRVDVTGTPDNSSRQSFVVECEFTGEFQFMAKPEVGQQTLDEILETTRQSLQVLDLLMRQARSCHLATRSGRYYVANRNTFIIPDAPRPALMPNLEHWTGFFMAHHILQDGSLSLNFDVANSGFFKTVRQGNEKQGVIFPVYLCEAMEYMARNKPHLFPRARPEDCWWTGGGRNLHAGIDIYRSWPANGNGNGNGNGGGAREGGGLWRLLKSENVGFMQSKLSPAPKGIEIRYCFTPSKGRRAGETVKRVKRFRGFSSKSARDYTFMMTKSAADNLGNPDYIPGPRGSEPETVEISVASYFERAYGIRLNYPLLPPLLFKGRGKQDEAIPMELCWVEWPQRFSGELNSDQLAAIIKEAAKPAPQRRSTIETLHREVFASGMGPGMDPWLEAFRVNVGNQMIQTSACILPVPTIQYHQGNTTPRDGSWKVPGGARFLQPCRIEGFGLLGLGAPVQDDKWLKTFVTNACAKMGVQTDTNNYVGHKSIPTHMKAREALRDFKLEFDRRKLSKTVVFVVLPKRDPISYGEVKRQAEIEIGIMTQCILTKTVRNYKPMTGDNLALKVNTKMGGVNWAALPSAAVSRALPLEFPMKIEEAGLLVIGVDIVHPPTPKSGSRDRFGLDPSFAAFVYNVDGNFTRFGNFIKSQLKRREHIVYLADAVKNIVSAYQKWNQKKPSRILVFRDGISESSYKEVLTQEVHSVKKGAAVLDNSWNPPVTYVVANKRHHTRIFVQGQGCGKAQNVPPGTTVDTTITTAGAVEFFQVAHFGIQGTSRPIKYTVLYNEKGENGPAMSLPCIENITFHMTHVYARCQRSVSLPAPLYYAHLLCERAAHYKKSWSQSQSELDDSDDDEDASKSTKGMKGLTVGDKSGTKTEEGTDKTGSDSDKKASGSSPSEDGSGPDEVGTHSTASSGSGSGKARGSPPIADSPDSSSEHHRKDEHVQKSFTVRPEINELTGLFFI